MPETVSQQNIRVPFPGPGETIAVAAHSVVELLFAFDPASASVSRTGNGLVFETEEGGSVTITDFFDVADNSLPESLHPSQRRSLAYT